jgi:hypothetical protein
LKQAGYILPATENEELLIILNSAQVVKVTTLRNTKDSSSNKPTRALGTEDPRAEKRIPAELVGHHIDAEYHIT